MYTQVSIYIYAHVYLYPVKDIGASSDAGCNIRPAKLKKRPDAPRILHFIMGLMRAPFNVQHPNLFSGSIWDPYEGTWGHQGPLECSFSLLEHCKMPRIAVGASGFVFRVRGLY